jgi:hypothetical protein
MMVFEQASAAVSTRGPCRFPIKEVKGTKTYRILGHLNRFDIGTEPFKIEVQVDALVERRISAVRYAQSEFRTSKRNQSDLRNRLNIFFSPTIKPIELKKEI